MVFKFKFPIQPVLELKEGSSISRDRIISFLKSSNMISKGCIYHIVRVKDLHFEANTF